jgi:hypothetical protein
MYDAPDRRHRRDRGQAAVFLVIVLSALFVVSIAALAAMGGDIVDRTRAQTAADAAALASVADDRGAADAIARTFGAVVVSWARDDADVVVVVRVGDATASARATDAP